MLTAYDDDEAMVAAVIADAAGYVLKDIRGSRLVEVRARRSRPAAPALEPELVSAVRHRLRSETDGDPRLAGAEHAASARCSSLIADGLEQPADRARSSRSPRRP